MRPWEYVPNRKFQKSLDFYSCTNVRYLLGFTEAVQMCPGLTSEGRRRFPSLWSDCGANGVGSWTHSCWSARNPEMGRE